MQFQLDSLFGKLYKEGRFNGNVLIAEKGQVIYKKSFGLANELTKQALNENSIFELASCSKQFTAMSIAILNKQGKLKYDDRISKYMSELDFYKNVTIRQLLNHTSGMPPYENLMDSVWDKSKIATNEDIIAFFKKYKPALHFQPNDRYEYSNTGYALLAVIIERISKSTYPAFLKASIFNPLKMRHSLAYTRRYKPLPINNYAFGYVYDSTNKKQLPDSIPDFKEVYYLDGIHGDGTVNSTVNDLLLWDRSLYKEQLLNKNEMKVIFEPAVLNNKELSPYGFGWDIETNSELGKIVSHTGSWPGYRAYIERELDKDKTIIILQNVDRADMPVNFIRKILYNKPVHSSEINISDSILSSYVGEYQVSPESIITISKAGHQLKGYATEYGQLEIYPSTEHKFFLKTLDAELEFVKDEKGNVSKLIIDHQGMHIEAKKIK